MNIDEPPLVLCYDGLINWMHVALENLSMLLAERYKTTLVDARAHRGLRWLSRGYNDIGYPVCE